MADDNAALEARPMCIALSGVREYIDGEPVELVRHQGRICIRAMNEGRNNETLVDLMDLLQCLDLGPLLTTDQLG